MEITNRATRTGSIEVLDGVVEVTSISHTVGARSNSYIDEIRIGQIDERSGKISGRYLLVTNSMNISPAEITVGDILRIRGGILTEQVGSAYRISKPDVVENVMTGIKYG